MAFYCHLGVYIWDLWVQQVELDLSIILQVTVPKSIAGKIECLFNSACERYSKLATWKLDPYLENTSASLPHLAPFAIVCITHLDMHILRFPSEYPYYYVL